MPDHDPARVRHQAEYHAKRGYPETAAYLRAYAARLEHRCTYIDPETGQEVLAHRDERHVVIPAEEYRRLADALPKLERLARIDYEVCIYPSPRDPGRWRAETGHGWPGDKVWYEGGTPLEALLALADALATQEEE